VYLSDRLITRQTELYFVSRKDGGGEWYVLACQAVNEGNFLGVKMDNSKSNKEINRSQFYQALADSISIRLMTESDRPITDCVMSYFSEHGLQRLLQNMGRRS